MDLLGDCGFACGDGGASDARWACGCGGGCLGSGRGGGCMGSDLEEHGARVCDATYHF